MDEQLMAYNKALFIETAREMIWKCLASGYDHLKLRGLNTPEDDAEAERLRELYRQFKAIVESAETTSELPETYPVFVWCGQNP